MFCVPRYTKGGVQNFFCSAREIVMLSLGALYINHHTFLLTYLITNGRELGAAKSNLTHLEKKHVPRLLIIFSLRITSMLQKQLCYGRGCRFCRRHSFRGEQWLVLLTNRKPIYDFLLVSNCYLSCISHSFRDIALRSQKLTHPCLSLTSDQVDPLRSS